MLSPELFEARRGNITASSAHKMMAGWDTPRPTEEFPTPIYDWMDKHGLKPKVGEIKDVLPCDVSGKLIDAAWKAYQFDKPPQGLLTYAEELACDELFDYDPSLDFTSTHMSTGNEREVEAVQRLSLATGINFTKIGDDQIHVCTDGIGATPDGIAYDDLDLIHAGCEVKSRTPIHHARQLFINDNESLIEHDFERYCQIQVGYRATGASEWYSVNFNPFAKHRSHQLHWCVIERDDAFLKVFDQRAALVFEHKKRFLDSLNALKNDNQEQAA